MSVDESTKKENKLRARRRMMDHIARRDHSERELRKKLRGKFDPEDIDAALEYGKEKGWVPSTDESQKKLSGKMADYLHRKLKGIHHINQYLNEKGLPGQKADPELELEKAKELLKIKYPDLQTADSAQRTKAGRLLVSRGFEMDLVRRLIFKN